MTAKDSDPDWVPGDIQTKKKGSNRLTGKPSALLSKSKSLTVTPLPKKSTNWKAMKTLEASLCVHQPPKSLKKRRIMRKRMPLNKLIVQTKMIHDLRECAPTFNLTWMNVKRERSNTSIRRRDFSSPFAAHVVKESDDQCINHQDDVVSYNGNTQNRAAQFKTRFQQDKNIIVYKRKGKRKDSNSAVDFGKQKMDSDVPNQLDQNENAEVVNTCDDLSSSSFKALDPFVSEQNGCDGGNNCLVLETQHVIITEPLFGKNDESNLSSRVEEDLDCGNKANVNVNAWVPSTPEIQSKLGSLEKDSSNSWSANNFDGFMSNNIAPDSSAKTGSNCGKYESLLEILKSKRTRGVDIDSEKTPCKRLKMKRHRPKVFDRSKLIKISTPNPRTPKPTRKVKKKVDPGSKNDDGKKTRDSCRRKLDFNEECCMTGQEELNLKPQNRTESPISDLKVSVQQEELPCNVLCTCGTKTKIPEHSSESKTKNVLSIQDEALTEAMVDYVVQKMASLRIDDNVSKQLVVRHSNKFGAIVSSKQKKIDPSKNHKATVDLDPETLRIWDLLMGPNWSESTEADDVDDAEYMKGERKLFRQKIDKFLACMRVYQGDKQFSPWKASVVDSIVGVFLTQNVSDHLSSSAYMALASAYPPLSVNEQNAQLARVDQQLLLVEPPSSSQVEPDIENANESSSQAEATPVTKKGKDKKKQEKPINWDELRKQYSHGIPIKRTDHTADSINWEAVRQSSAEDLAKVIVNRGMNNQLAGRIKGFLDRLVTDHGSIDLEWLRNVPPPKAKDYLLSISGLGLKSTECVRLLALHFPAFPVDTNAGRFFVRVGWVPLKPLPDSVQLHLLNQYPVLDSVQKYLWPRLCDRDHPTLYETHCHSVTVAKTFCTKTRPNCKECPMRGECRHYASAVASSSPHLEGSQPKTASDSSTTSTQEAPLLTNFDGDQSEKPYNCCIYEPIIEFPASPEPEPEPMEALGGDIEDIWRDCEIPTITLNGVEFSEKIRSFISEGDAISKALVALSPKVASIPMPKLKEAIRLRTVHQVYELPDSHHLLAAFENREPEDPCPYLLAIWTADETANSSQESDTVRSSQEMTTGDACSSREVARYEKHDKVQGTILIPCRTANRGRFPLNGTYFQTNEVFADHASSRQPIDVPRQSIWNLRKRTLYCGTSITSICKGMSDLEIAYCFQKSSICNRGFNTKTRAATSLAKRFHVCKSRQPDD